jgi:FlaA1/EpsC-like NDP-sugar epimerase
MKRYYKSIRLAVFDAVLLVISFACACYLTGQSVSAFGVSLWPLLVLVVVLQLPVFLRFGFYRAILRYAGIDFLISVVKGVSIAVLVLMVGFYIAQVHVSVRALVIDWFLTVALVGGSRFFVRYCFELRQRYQKGRRVLIYGAGDMGELAFRQLIQNKDVLYSPIGYIDDNDKKRGAIIRGIKVLGELDSLESIVEKYRIEEVVVAIAEIGSDKLSTIVVKCRQKNIVCRIIPCFSRLVSIEPDIRNIELADLMRRTPRDLDKNAIEKYIKGKKVLITGAAGSIGSEIVRQCLKFNPELIFAVDQSEFGLYTLREELGDGRVKYVLCDITNKNALNNIFEACKIEIVFHAAAYKHVPLLELNPVEAVRNNIASTRNLCEVADQHKLESFIMISSDKAVRASSVMGATKRVCELIVQNFDAKSSTKFLSVRFGNVLGSSGSVVPKFVEQIRKGGPVTITHPDTTRYFMLIDEAAQLVLQAATIGNGREIFILDMGKPVKIKDMAEDLIYLMGRQPHDEVKIVYSGLRAGEKIHEELFNSEIENTTKFKEITVAKPSHVDKVWLENRVEELMNIAQAGNNDKVLRHLAEIVSDGMFSGTTLVSPLTFGREDCYGLQ